MYTYKHIYIYLRIQRQMGVLLQRFRESVCPLQYILTTIYVSTQLHISYIHHMYNEIRALLQRVRARYSIQIS